MVKVSCLDVKNPEENEESGFDCGWIFAIKNMLDIGSNFSSIKGFRREKSRLLVGSCSSLSVQAI